MATDLSSIKISTDVILDKQATSLSHLGTECLQCIASMLKSDDRLALLLCGNKLFSIKWANGFRELECTSSSWRTLAYEVRMGGKAGRTKTPVCLFPHLQLLTLDPWSRTCHKPLTGEEIKVLPRNLIGLSIALKKNTCDIALPPNLATLHMSNLSEDFNPRNPWSSTIMQLALLYKKAHTRLPRHLSQMNNLTTLTLKSTTPISAEHIQVMPPSLTRLVLFGADGCFKNQGALDAVGRVLVNLQSAKCHHVLYQAPCVAWLPPRPNLSVLPPTVTHLDKAFMDHPFGSVDWLDYPRQLIAFDDKYITVYGANPNQQYVKQHLMHHIPPLYRRIHLIGVTLSCPLRFVTHLCLSAARYVITQTQIEACKSMASVIHLVLENALDHHSGSIDLSVSSWRLQSLKVTSTPASGQESLYLDDYAPWLTESLTSLHLHCIVLISNIVDKLPSSIKTLQLRVAGDMATTIGNIHPNLLPLVDFTAATDIIKSN